MVKILARSLVEQWIVYVEKSGVVSAWLGGSYLKLRNI